MFWRHHHSRFSLLHFWVLYPTDFKFSKRILLYSHEHVTGLPSPHSLPPKGLKILHVPIHLRCHFSVGTYHKGTLQPELGILIYLEDQYLSTISKINPSSKQSPNYKILFKCDMSIDSRTRITVVGDRSFTNMLRIKNSLFQATIKSRLTYI